MSCGEVVISALTIVAIFVGPVVAVFVTRQLDLKRLDRDRKMEVFRTLMRTRRATLSPDHVGALNLVEIEFHDRQAVVSAWTDYARHLSERRSGKESDEDVRMALQTGDQLLARMLREIAKSLGFEIEQLDIMERGYAPQGWADIEYEQQVLRRHLIEMLECKRPIPLVDFGSNQKYNPFPPRPQ